MMEDFQGALTVLETRMANCLKTLPDLWYYEFGFNILMTTKTWATAAKERDEYKYYQRIVVSRRSDCLFKEVIC